MTVPADADDPCPAWSRGALAMSVVVPSYRRPEDLRQCLAALAAQTRAADEVLVVLREEDAETLAVCAEATELRGLRRIIVARPGMVAALNAGARAAQGDLIAITDDDCRPEADWLRELELEFASDPAVGAVGGPDLVEDPPPPTGTAVGRVRWYGRITGNHQAGTARQQVHFLKGANMAFRAEVLAGFDERLRGAGAQVGNDMQATLSVWRRGYRVIYSPAVRVRHYPATRSKGDPRQAKEASQLRDQHHNEMCVVASTLNRWRTIAVIAYAVIVGYRSALGLGHLGLRLVRGPARRRALHEFAWVNLGRIQGLLTALRERAPRRYAQRERAGVWKSA